MSQASSLNFIDPSALASSVVAAIGEGKTAEVRKQLLPFATALHRTRYESEAMALRELLNGTGTLNSAQIGSVIENLPMENFVQAVRVMRAVRFLVPERASSWARYQLQPDIPVPEPDIPIDESKSGVDRFLNASLPSLSAPTNPWATQMCSEDPSEARTVADVPVPQTIADEPPVEDIPSGFEKLSPAEMLALAGDLEREWKGLSTLEKTNHLKTGDRRTINFGEETIPRRWIEETVKRRREPIDHTASRGVGVKGDRVDLVTREKIGRK